MHMPSVIWPILGSFGVLLLIYLAVLRRESALLRWFSLAKSGTAGQPTRPTPHLFETQAGPATLSAPLSGAACVFWQIEIFSKGEPGQRSTLDWYRLLNQTSDTPLRISTSEGALLIAPAQAELFLTSHAEQQIGAFDKPTPEFLQVLQQFGVPLERKGFQRRLKIRERVIAPGQPISVCGSAARSNGQTVLQAAPDQPLLLADLDSQGLRGALIGQVAKHMAMTLALVVLIWLIWLLETLG
jgi:hypothetical protein